MLSVGAPSTSAGGVVNAADDVDSGDLAANVPTGRWLSSGARVAVAAVTSVTFTRTPSWSSIVRRQSRRSASVWVGSSWASTEATLVIPKTTATTKATSAASGG
jgi:hypothetical protein